MQTQEVISIKVIGYQEILSQSTVQRNHAVFASYQYVLVCLLPLLVPGVL